jgi:hypothetical protein
MYRNMMICFAMLLIPCIALAQGDSKANGNVTITCSGATLSIVESMPIKILVGENVHFGLGQPACALVTVNGNSPIGNFDLKWTGGTKDTTIAFPTAGTYSFTVSGAKGTANGLLFVQEPPVPSLTEYGLIGLAAILVLSGVWIFWRRRALA